MKKETEKIEIPFGAKDSELHKFEYTIPEGYEAEIKDGKVILQKKESEDERILEAIIFRLGQLSEIWFENIFCKQFTKAQILAYLEKQKEQKSAEWSEEDDLMRDAILNTLERVGDYGTIGMQKDWLKSLHPQPHWKPSKKQMKELLNALIPGKDFDCDILAELYEQLKVL